MNTLYDTMPLKKIEIGVGKLAYLKVDSGKILDKFPWKSNIPPLQGNGMAAIPKMLSIKII